jgi:hypothetical protein
VKFTEQESNPAALSVPFKTGETESMGENQL